MKHLIAIRNPKSKIRNRPAFTMMELMMAIGIFAIGMGLIAGLFPAAVKESESAVKDYEGPTICQNGLAIVKARLTHPLTIGNIATEIVDCSSLLGPCDLQYPSISPLVVTVPADQRRFEVGYLVLGMQWSGRNDYTLMLAAYEKRDPNNTVVTETLTVSSVNPNNDNPCPGYVHEDATEFTITGGTLPSGDRDKIVGSPAIDYRSDGSGRYAIISAVDGNTVYMERSIGEDAHGVMVIVEKNAGGAIQDGSPVTQMMMTRTALRDSSSGGGGGGGMPSQ